MEELFPHRTGAGIDIIDVAEFFVGFMMIDIDEKSAGLDILYHPVHGSAVQKHTHIGFEILVKGRFEMLDSGDKGKIIHDGSGIIQPDCFIHLFQEIIQSQLGSDAVSIGPDMPADKETALVHEDVPDLPDDLFKLLRIQGLIIIITLVSHDPPFISKWISDG